MVHLAVRSIDTKEAVLQRGVGVILKEAEALRLMAEELDESFVEACNTILAARGRVVVTGMGKSGHIGRKWASTMAATGTPAIYVHPAEASHGDLGMVVPGDVLVVLSNSGNTGELRSCLRYASSIGVKIIGVASRRKSLVMRYADVPLCYPAVREVCPANVAPTTSTTLQLALGDALAMVLMDMRGFTVEGLRKLHPGGALGLRLTPVEELMHDGDRLPLVTPDTAMSDVVGVMTSSGFGIAGVIDPMGCLMGVITDGDLRRHFTDLSAQVASDVMTGTPKTLSPDVIAEEALQFLNESKITAAFVVEPSRLGEAATASPKVRPVGIVHIHDFLKLGLG